MPQPKKSPAFQFYPKDWLSDSNVARMSFAAKGMYIDMLAICWMDGCVPSDPADLAAVLRTSVDEVRAVYSHLERCFKSDRHRPGFWRHQRLDLERSARDRYRKSAAESGKRGAEKRWNNNKKDREPNKTPMGKDSSPISSLLSPTPEREIPNGISPPCPPVGLDVSAWDRWVDYRKKTRRAIKPASVEEAQRQLAGFGEDQAAVVAQSIAAGWQGLFPLKQPQHTNGHTNGRRKRNAAEQAWDDYAAEFGAGGVGGDQTSAADGPGRSP